MSKKNVLWQSIEKIDDKYIEEAYMYRKTKHIKNKVISNVAIAAAMLFVAFTVSIYVLEDSDESSSNNVAIEETIYVTQKILQTYEESINSLEELEGDAVLIVRGKRVDEDTEGTKSTLSKFVINEIYKDEKGGYCEGDIITICEDEYYEENTVICHINGYDMMVAECQYLLILSIYDMEQEIYYGGNYGTISLENDGRYTEEYMGELNFNIEKYTYIWDLAKQKYIK